MKPQTCRILNYVTNPFQIAKNLPFESLLHRKQKKLRLKTSPVTALDFFIFQVKSREI